MSLISDQLIPWQKKFGRNNLPWQETKNPYPIWVSEVMLQQTQVKTVLPYYRKFITIFPNVKSLAGIICLGKKQKIHILYGYLKLCYNKPKLKQYYHIIENL